MLISGRVNYKEKTPSPPPIWAEVRVLVQLANTDVNELGGFVTIGPVIEFVRRDNFHIVHLREQTDVRFVGCNLVAVYVEAPLCGYPHRGAFWCVG